MNPMESAVTSCIDDLQAAGMKATANPQRLDLPGAWVTPNMMSYNVLAQGVCQVTLDVLLIARGTDFNTDMADLDKMAMTAADVLDISDWRADSVTATNYSPDALPALVGQITYQWKEDQQ